MSERIHGIYDLGRTGNKHKGDVMERREQTTTTTVPSIKQLINRFENAVHQAAKDDYVDGGSYAAMDRRAKAVEDARRDLQDTFNQHTTLVEQRDLLVGIAKDALRFRELNYGECGHDTLMVKVCSQCEIRAALATVEQGGKTR